MSLASDVTSMPKENIRFYQEVGTPAYFNGLWYYLLDADKTTALMSKIMNNETITDEDINIPSVEIPVLQGRTEKTKHYSFPKIGEVGICIFPENTFNFSAFIFEEGVII